MEQMLALATVLSRMEDNALKMQCIPGRSKTIGRRQLLYLRP